jgi:LacI family repressor for deo operon, udp, cdd, tsx, nupC, and nupG
VDLSQECIDLQILCKRLHSARCLPIILENSAANEVNRKRGPSIEDVARQAGVSVATVSRALRGLPNVAASTKARVEKVADEMNYRADPSAARLATGRTNLVQISTPTVDGWYFSRFIAGAIDHLLLNGYETITHPVEDPKAREQFLSDVAQLDKRVDGAILVDLNISEAAATDLWEAGVPTVTAGFATRLFPAVLIDDYQVGYLATEHLLSLGHTRIGVISGEPNHPLVFSVPGLRLAGYTGALAESGIAVDPSLEQSGRFTADGGRLAMERILDMENPPTALFVLSDEMAFGAWSVLKERGLSWPDDMAIIGIDDHELAPLVGLSTVRLAPRRLGAAAAERLLSVINDVALLDVPKPNSEGKATEASLEWLELVVRQSTIGNGDHVYRK